MPGQDRRLRRRGPGRPVDDGLTIRLLEVTVQLLADRGFDRLKIDTVASRAQAGKAGIYRRWDNIAVLAGDALQAAQWHPPPVDTGSVTGDVEVLLASWQAPLTPAERAAAAVLGVGHTNGDVHRGLTAFVDGYMQTVMTSLEEHAQERGAPLAAIRVDLLAAVLRALYLSRLSPSGPADLSDEDVVHLGLILGAERCL